MSVGMRSHLTTLGSSVMVVKPGYLEHSAMGKVEGVGNGDLLSHTWLDACGIARSI
jgi:hypothetical protein